jgi:hypothetical protein
MKTIVNSIWSFFDAMGTARAAAYLARQGLHKEAAALYNK